MTAVDAARPNPPPDRSDAGSGAPPLPFTETIRRWIGFVTFGLLVYVPILLTDPGKVEADTKTYLYLDPGRLLSEAMRMWDPEIGMGTVSHQTIGYLFPMGPFYWVLEQALGLPSWVAQRLWMATLLFAAGMGVWFLLKTIGMRGPGVVVGVFAYTFTPYVLQYSSRFSVILGPWAALGWMIAFAMLALRRGGWKYPALFAVTVQLVGSVNATALLFAGLGPLLFIPYSVWVLADSTWRRAWQVVWRTGLLTIVTSLWWISGLWAQGSYGLDILKYTETVETVSLTSYSNEIIRGLGYWFFYFKDLIGPWNDAVINMTQWRWLILVSYAVPALALLSGVIVGWRHRGFFVLLVLVGMIVAVGASPFDNPSILGSLFKDFAASSSAGLALRSTSRAVPLVALGMAGLLAAGVTAVADALARHRRGWLGLGIAAFVGALVLLNAPGIWNGGLYSRYLERDEAIPKYWTRALRTLDAQPHDTRVLSLPGSDFAAYRWGVTIDPIEPGLMDRPYVARELVPWGSPASAGFLEAFDRRIQAGQLEPDAIAPVARKMAVGDILLRMDLQTERYNLIRSSELWKLFSPIPPAGLEPAKTFGTKIPGKPAVSRIDEETIAIGRAGGDPPPVAVLRVKKPLAITRTTSADKPIVLAGDADGVMDASAVGLLDPNRILLFSGSYAKNPGGLAKQVARDATLVVTDTNRKRSHRWTGARDNSGHTEQVDEKPLKLDQRDARLELFPGSGTAQQTVAEQRGVKVVEASDYGLAGLAPQPGFRAVRAADGDPRTAWEVGGNLGDVEGQSIRIVADAPITTDHVNLLQPIRGPRGRWVDTATLSFDGGHPVKIRLGRQSRDPSAIGQTVKFPQQTFTTFELRIDSVHEKPLSQWKITAKPGDSVRWNASYVGFAEIRLRDDKPGSKDLKVDEYVRMPTDLLAAIGTASLDHPLVFTMTRDGRAGDPVTDSEFALQRVFSVPTARDFTVGGSARINPGAPDNVIDSVLGFPGADAGGYTVTTSDRLFGDVASRGSSAIDNDPKTAWTTPIGDILGQWVRVETPAPITFDHLDLQVVNDGVHSVPTELKITSDDGTTRNMKVPDVASEKKLGSTARVPVTFEPITGKVFTVSLEAVREVIENDYATQQPNVMPVGIAELGIPGVVRPPAPTNLAGECRSDLLTIDAVPVPIRVSGTTANATTKGPLTVARCNPDGGAVRLVAGTHQLRAAPGLQTGIDVDRLVLSSGAGGSAATISTIAAGEAGATNAGASGAPALKVVKQGPTSAKLEIPAGDKPYWLVLGQSNNAGWTAKADGKDLGTSKLVDGYANGWLIKPTGRPVTVNLDWTPQRVVNIAIGASLVGVLACIGILIAAAVRRRRTGTAHALGVSGASPVIESPFVARGATPGRVAIVATGLAAGIAAAVLIRPWCGLLVGGLVVLVLIQPRLRWLVSLFPVLAVLLLGIAVVANQSEHSWPTDINWPTHFWALRTLGWLAVVTLAADALIGLVRGAEPVGRHAPLEPPGPATDDDDAGSSPPGDADAVSAVTP